MDKEGRAYLDTLQHWLVMPESNGRFSDLGSRAGRVRPRRESLREDAGKSRVPIASRVVHFSVKPGQTQLDLGKLVIPSLRPPKVGAFAPRRFGVPTVQISAKPIQTAVADSQTNCRYRASRIAQPGSHAGPGSFDDAGKPLAEAVVRVEVTKEDDLQDQRTYQCDAQGRTTVALPKNRLLCPLYASKPGFCAEQKGSGQE